jgi:hypothetical protein
MAAVSSMRLFVVSGSAPLQARARARSAAARPSRPGRDCRGRPRPSRPRLGQNRLRVVGSASPVGTRSGRRHSRRSGVTACTLDRDQQVAAVVARQPCAPVPEPASPTRLNVGKYRCTVVTSKFSSDNQSRRRRSEYICSTPGGQAPARQQPPEPDHAPGIEAEHDQSPATCQDALALAQQLVRLAGALVRMRQQHGIHGVARDGQLPVLGNEAHARRRGSGRRLRASHGARETDELLRAAPGADLQQLAAEHAPQRLRRRRLLRGAQPQARGDSSHSAKDQAGSSRACPLG